MKRKKSLGILAVCFGLAWSLAACRGQEEEQGMEARARDIHERALTVDTHADTPSLMLREDWDIAERHAPGQRRSGNIDLPRMKDGGLDAEFFAVFVGQGPLTTEGYAKARKRADNLLDAIHRMCVEHTDLVELALTPEDAYRLEKQGKRAAFIGLENGYPIGQDLSLVQYYFGRSVRYITLCHGGDNDICDSSTDRRHPEDRGLSAFGCAVVAECNRLGIMVDVSHISDESFFDVLAETHVPVIASHSSVRALCDHPRNLSDDMLLALKANGGVIQISLVSSFLKTPEPNPERDKALEELQATYGSWGEIEDETQLDKMRRAYIEVMEKYPMDKATLSDLVDHIDYVVKLIGIDHVGIGSDFDGGGGVDGCDDVSKMPRITEKLLRRGYSEEDIRKIWGGNLVRVFGMVMEAAQSLNM